MPGPAVISLQSLYNVRPVRSALVDRTFPCWRSEVSLHIYAQIISLQVKEG